MLANSEHQCPICPLSGSMRLTNCYRADCPSARYYRKQRQPRNPQNRMLAAVIGMVLLQGVLLVVLILSLMYGGK